MAETDDKLEAIRARHAAASRGPWRWFGYLSNRDVGIEGHGVTVMEFARWGARGAQPLFSVKGILTALADLVVPDTAEERGRVTDINHPDARFIAASWQDGQHLLGMVDALRARVAELENALAALTECPFRIDEASVPKKGIDAAPDQVVGTMSVGLPKLRVARALLGLEPDGRGGWHSPAGAGATTPQQHDSPTCDESEVSRG
ncbi:hypothetical protein [Corallococcus exiguus]|uniref:hypothetical protein n=1 Tax=Corallococcus exiguus TaxID=83462 RepID=UPI0014724198|nr:hypothetical protein [Corallococcus exiguus]NNB86745.1 hypothetical protein [Corallococcus exiguus]